MSSSLVEFVGKLDKAATGIKGAEKAGVQAATIAAKETMVAAAESVRTPKTINTARGRVGNAWRVRYLWFTSEAKPRSVVFYGGAPPYWREQGTQMHDVKLRKKQALLINGLFADSASVRGVSRRPFWLAAKTEIARQSEPILHEATTASLIKAGYR